LFGSITSQECTGKHNPAVTQNAYPSQNAWPRMVSTGVVVPPTCPPISQINQEQLVHGR
jgi:hypothetical protein